jgi:hypothetical protein
VDHGAQGPQAGDNNISMQNSITLRIDNKEATFKWNSSMRLADFVKLNELQETQGTVIFAMCGDAHKKARFGSLRVDQVTKVKEEIVKKDKGFKVKITATAYQSAKADDLHLMDAYIDKQNKKHARVVEQAMLWQQARQQEQQDNGQTNVAKEVVS